MSIQRTLNYARLCTLMLTTMLSVPTWAAEPTPTPEARARFDAGVAHLVAERFENAYREFKAAYSITPTWKILGNLGIAADHLERDGEAIDAFEAYVKRGAKAIEPKEAREVRNDIERLRSGIATVAIDVPSAATFWIVDERVDAFTRVTNRYGPFDHRTHLRVRAGQHEFSVEGTAAARWSVSLLAGDVASHSFAPVSEPPAKVDTQNHPVPTAPSPDSVKGPSHTASYLLWAGGGLGAVASAVLFIEANRIQSDGDSNFARQCPLGAVGTPDCQETTPDSRRAANWRTASLVTGVVAIGALATGTVLYFIDASATPTDASAEASLGPWLGPTGIGLSGRF